MSLRYSFVHVRETGPIRAHSTLSAYDRSAHRVSAALVLALLIPTEQEIKPVRQGFEEFAATIKGPSPK